MSEWIEVKDKLPDNLGHFIIFFVPVFKGSFTGFYSDGNNPHYVKGFWHDDGRWDAEENRLEEFEVTHWMPWPNNPEIKS